MKIFADKRLFWFLKEGVQLDLGDPSALDMYVQQVITRGGTQDVKKLLKVVDSTLLKKALGRLRNFLPEEVRRSWEDFVGSNK